jgi:hypothetical protein
MIEDYAKHPEEITLFLIDGGELSISYSDFKKYLKDNGFLYHEEHNAESYKSYNLSLDNYFEWTTYEDVLQDLTQYLYEQKTHLSN